MDNKILKAVIVDDELPIRRELGSFDWAAFGARLTGEASNGRDGLEVIRERRPDVVFLDITMPIMDGFELLTLLKKEQPDIFVVILSCHNDYEHLRQSLKLGAFDYVLKTNLVPEEIGAVLGRVRENLDRKPAGEKAGIEAENAALRESIISYRPGGGGRLVFPLSLSMVFSPDSPLPPFVQSEIEIAVKKSGRDIKLVKNDGKSLFLVYQKSDTRWHDTVNGIVLPLYEGKLAPLSLFIAHGGRASAYEELPALLERVKEASRVAFYRRNSPGAISPGMKTIFPDAAMIDDLLAKSRLIWQLGGGLDSFLSGPFSAWAQTNLIDSAALKSALLTICEECFNGSLDLTNPNVVAFMGIEPGSLRELVIEASVKIKNLIELRSSRPEVRLAVRYMNENCTRKLKLAEAAQAAGISPNYLNKLLKDETGIGFNENLVKVRLERAKILLTGSNLRVYEVAEQVGIPNYRYFTKLFKDTFGVSPNVFKYGYGKDSGEYEEN